MQGVQIFGKLTVRGGASGNVAIPAGAIVLFILAHSSGVATVAIFGGDAIPIISGAAPTQIPCDHQNLIGPIGGGNIVFTGTDSFVVVFVQPGVQ